MALPTFDGRLFVGGLLHEMRQLSRTDFMLGHEPSFSRPFVTAQEIYEVLRDGRKCFAQLKRLRWDPDGTYLYEWTLRDVAYQILDFAAHIYHASRPFEQRPTFTDLCDSRDGKPLIVLPVLLMTFLMSIDRGQGFLDSYRIMAHRALTRIRTKPLDPIN